MRNRLIVLATALVFAASVASVAVVAGRGDDESALEKLPVGAAGVNRQAADALASDEMSLIAPVAIEYRLAGPLPDLASSAPAYRLAATTTVAEVARLARVFGFGGPVVEERERFVVRSGERELAVERQPGLPWYLGANVSCPEGIVSSDGVVRPDSPVSSESGIATKCAYAIAQPAPAPSAVVVEPGSKPAQALIAPPPLTVPVPPTCPPDLDCGVPPVPPARPADLPSRSEAEAQARALFTALRVGLDGFEVSDGFDAWYASVQPRVDGLAVGWSTSVTIGARGEVQWASGFLAVPERIGDYPLAGTAAGFKRLQAGEFNGGWFGYDGGDKQVQLGAPEQGVATDDIARPPPERFVQTITGVSLALSFLGDRLVPVYRFEIIDGGGYVEVPAVVDELLEEHDIVDR